MKKEFGKWLMDIAKYLATAILLSSLFSDLSDNTPFGWSLAATTMCLIGGLALIGAAQAKEEKKKRKRTKRKGGKYADYCDVNFPYRCVTCGYCMGCG